MKKLWITLFISGFLMSQGVAQQPGHIRLPVCQILDYTSDPVSSVGIEFVQSRGFTGYDDSGIISVDGAWKLAYFHDVLLGDIDLSLDMDGTLFLRSADLQLPDQLLALAADVGWTWRYINGTALQLRAAPGIYSDIEELNFRSMAMPVSAAGIMTVAPELSAIAGVEVRAGFERWLMPIFGAVWQPANWLRIEATVPEARLECLWSHLWSSHVSWEWESATYRIREKGDYDRKKITLDSYRTAAGVTYAVSDSLHVTGEIGKRTERSVEFKHAPVGMDEEIDIHDGWFLRVGIGGPL